MRIPDWDILQISSFLSGSEKLFGKNAFLFHHYFVHYSDSARFAQITESTIFRNSVLHDHYHKYIIGQISVVSLVLNV